MKKLLSSLLSLLLLWNVCAVGASAQIGNVTVITGNGAPTGNCPNTNTEYLNTANGNLYTCPVGGGAWVYSSGGSSGYFYNTGLAARLSNTILPTENTPATIVNTTQDVDGFTDMFPDGTFVEVYQSPIPTGTTSSVVMRTSTDQGNSWSAANVVLSGTSASTYYFCCSGGVTPTGRIVIGYQAVVNTVNTGLYTIYSDNEGAVWSTPVQVDTVAGQIYGKMIAIGNGQLLLPAYSVIAGTDSTYVYTSSNNGATWSASIPVLSSASLGYTEASYAYLGGQTILGMVRCDNCTDNNAQVLSTNNGATWTLQGNANYNHDGVGNSPWLSTFMGPNGRRVVEWLTQLRSLGEEVVAYGYASDLIAGTAGWNTHSQQIVGTFPFCTDLNGYNGYGSIIHPYDTEFALGRYHYVNNATCATAPSTTVFFTTPVGKAIPIDTELYGSLTADATAVAPQVMWQRLSPTSKMPLLSISADGTSIGLGGNSGGGGQAMVPDHNVAVGYNALNSILATSGSTGNTGVGVNVDINGTGTNNTFAGYAAGFNLAGSQSNNVFIGAQAGENISGGSTVNAAASNETLIGYQSYPLASGDTNEGVFGATSTGFGSNTNAYGNTAITSHNFYGGIVTHDSSFGSSQTNGQQSACATSFAPTSVNTGSATTTTALSCLPASSVIDAVVYRVTTAITTAASFTVGQSGSTSQFCGTQSTLTLGATGTCVPSAYAPQSAAAAVVVTFNATPGAGAIRLIVYYHTWTAPTS